MGSSIEVGPETRSADGSTGAGKNRHSARHRRAGCLYGRTHRFVARRIITMDPDIPDATAVTVTDGRIIAVGDLDKLGRDANVDHTFAEAVICRDSSTSTCTPSWGLPLW